MPRDAQPTQTTSALPGRDGFSNAELCAMWPRLPNVTCDGCRERKTCTRVLYPIGLWCDECLRMPSRPASLSSTRGGSS